VIDRTLTTLTLLLHDLHALAAALRTAGYVELANDVDDLRGRFVAAAKSLNGSRPAA
jgi:hypothetical protein